MDEHRDRLIDMLLEEELGGESPPDLTEQVVARAFGRRRWWRVALAAAVLLAIVLSAWWQFRPIYPLPQAGGDFQLLAGSLAGRDARLQAGAQTAWLNLGGYCTIELQPRTVVQLEGEPGAEAIALEAGQAHCSVNRAVGTFVVRTPAGAVSVEGTEFVVRVEENRGTHMSGTRMFVRVLVGTVLLSGSWGALELSAGEAAAADEKGAEKRKGVVTGVVTAKGENFLEVRADGEEKGRRYVPHWVGGTPAQGGGPDKAILAQIAKIPIGARVRLEWEFEERARVVKVEVLQAPKK
jgi:ferric-dicitrate binding protein FerR (iron transport regulator)